MFFSASIKPTSTVHGRWVSRTQTCGFIEGVCFLRRPVQGGVRYIADRITAAQMEQLRKNISVHIAATAMRIPDETVDAPAQTAAAKTLSLTPPKRIK